MLDVFLLVVFWLLVCLALAMIVKLVLPQVPEQEDSARRRQSE